MDIRNLITIDSDILGRQPVFTGKRCQLKPCLINRKQGGLNDFLEDFAGVAKEQAIAISDTANKLLTSKPVSNQMKPLLDENLPKRLKQNFPRYEVFTVRKKAGTV